MMKRVITFNGTIPENIDIPDADSGAIIIVQESLGKRELYRVQSMMKTERIQDGSIYIPGMDLGPYIY